MRSWIRSLRARNLAPKTIRGYTESASQLIEHLRGAGVTTAPEIQRAHVEDYLAGVAARWRLATVSVRYRALQQFFGWLLDEEEIERNPMARMKPPTVPENPVPVLTLDELRRLVASCEGRSLADRRDSAIIRLFADTGMRVSELAGLAVRRRRPRSRDYHQPVRRRPGRRIRWAGNRRSPPASCSASPPAGRPAALATSSARSWSACAIRTCSRPACRRACEASPTGSLRAAASLPAPRVVGDSGYAGPPASTSSASLLIEMLQPSLLSAGATPGGRFSCSPVR